MKRWMKFWQGHEVEELLLIVIGALFFTGLTLGLLHVALMQQRAI